MTTGECGGLREHSASGGMWSLLFWAELAAGGWAILRLSNAHIRVAGHTYSCDPMDFHSMAAVTVWVALCLVGYLGEKSIPGAGGWLGRFASTARKRAVALFPLIGIVVVAWLSAVTGGDHFEFRSRYDFLALPVAMLGVGFSAGRLAAVYRDDAHSARTDDTAPALKWPFVVVVLCAAGMAGIWSVELVFMLDGGHLGYFDTGTFASRWVNTLRGSAPFREHPAVAPFWDHFNPGFYLLLPLGALFDPVRALLAVQCVGAAAPALIWFFYARRRGHTQLRSMLIGLAWLMLPSVSQMTFGMARGFHPVVLAMPLVAASLLCVCQRRWAATAILALLACSLRETVALAYVGVAFWLLAERGRRSAGAVVLVAALLYFGTSVGLVIPAFSGGESYLAAERFEHLGNGLFDVVLSPFSRPDVFLRSVFSRQSFLFVAVLLSSVGFLPVLFGRRRLLALLPAGALILLWQDPLLRSICFHYHAMTLLLLFWIAVEAVSCRHRRHHAWTLLGAAMTGSFYLGWWPALRDTTPFDRDPPRTEITAFVRGQSGSDATVAASICMAVHCVEAAEVIPLSSFDPDGEWPDVFVLDYADDWGRFNLSESLPAVRSLHKRLMDGPHVLTGVLGPVAVYRRTGSPVQAGASCVPAVPDAALRESPLRLTDELSLVGWSLAPLEAREGRRRPGRLRVEAYIRVREVPREDLGIGFVLIDPSFGSKPLSASMVRPAGGMAVPSTSWRPGRTVLESHQVAWVWPFPPDRRRLTLRVDLYDLSTGQRNSSVLCD